MALKDDILLQIRRLLPNGLAFKFKLGGVWENFWKGLIGDSSTTSSLVYVRNDALNVLDCLIPDNSNFGITDAHDWYRRFGMYDSGTMSLPDMKTAILQRMAWNSNPLDQQTASYIQTQLHNAGFPFANVFVNNFGAGGEAVSLYSIYPFPNEIAMCNLVHCNDTQCGTQAQTSGTGTTIRKVANYVEETKDDFIRLGYPNYRSTFFIANTMSYPPLFFHSVTVPIGRKQELRQLILKLKSQQMVCWLNADYV